MAAGQADSPQRGEFELIANILAPLTGGDPRALGLTDDAAVLPQKTGTDTVVSTDTMVAGIHFLMVENPDIIARRLLRVNLSDIAAMGAEPAGYFLNLTLPADIENNWLERFASGLAEDQREFGINLFGGDTTHTTGPLALSITMLGEVPSGAAVRRSTARPGDIIFVSGTIGDAGIGLSRLVDSGSTDDAMVQRYQLPTPRVGLGTALRGIASAMADVSDGLVADLGHICAASGVAATVRADAVPLSDGARAAQVGGEADIGLLLTSGDDYELIFAASPGREEDVLAAAARANVPVAEIGSVAEGEGVTVLDADGGDISPEIGGYRHF
jgi:thiamine-monophosphate kinase